MDNRSYAGVWPVAVGILFIAGYHGRDPCRTDAGTTINTGNWKIVLSLLEDADIGFEWLRIQCPYMNNINVY